MSDLPVLFDYWRSSASYRVRLALAIKGVEYLSHPVNLVQAEQRGDTHMSRNPMGAVPVLQIDGLRLTQSLAIIEYLDESRDGPALLPKGAAMHAQARALAHIIAADTHPLGNLPILQRVEALAGEQAKLEWVLHVISKGLIAYEAHLAQMPRHRFTMGDTPMLPDLCLIPQLYNAMRWGVDLKGLPRCLAIQQAFAELPAFEAAHPNSFAPVNA